MDFKKLMNFIENDMSMSNIYQPVVIKKLLESNNTVSIKDLAKTLINKDNSLLEYYKERLTTWPKTTLLKHKIVKYNKGKNSSFTLLLEEISEKQKNSLIESCDKKILDFIKKHSNTWGIKTSRKSMSGSRYSKYAEAKGRCLACGISASETKLQLDHIIPLNKNGPDIPDNLQVLCEKCNKEKRDTDDTDFKDWDEKLEHSDPNCTLCDLISKEPLESNVMAVFTQLKSNSNFDYVIIPKRHIGTFFDLIPAEKHSCLKMLDIAKSYIEKKQSVKKINVGFDSEITNKNEYNTHCCITVKLL